MPGALARALVFPFLPSTKAASSFDIFSTSTSGMLRAATCAPTQSQRRASMQKGGQRGAERLLSTGHKVQTCLVASQEGQAKGSATVVRMAFIFIPASAFLLAAVAPTPSTPSKLSSSDASSSLS